MDLYTYYTYIWSTLQRIIFVIVPPTSSNFEYNKINNNNNRKWAYRRPNNEWWYSAAVRFGPEVAGRRCCGPPTQSNSWFRCWYYDERDASTASQEAAKKEPCLEHTNLREFPRNFIIANDPSVWFKRGHDKSAGSLQGWVDARVDSLHSAYRKSGNTGDRNKHLPYAQEYSVQHGWPNRPASRVATPEQRGSALAMFTVQIRSNTESIRSWS